MFMQGLQLNLNKLTSKLFARTVTNSLVCFLGLMTTTTSQHTFVISKNRSHWQRVDPSGVQFQARSISFHFLFEYRDLQIQIWFYVNVLFILSKQTIFSFDAEINIYKYLYNSPRQCIIVDSLEMFLQWQITYRSFIYNSTPYDVTTHHKCRTCYWRDDNVWRGIPSVGRRSNQG